MEYPEEIIVERVGNEAPYKIRCVIIERDPDNGCRSVRDIIETTYFERGLGNFFASYAVNGAILSPSMIHGVDFGKAVKLGSRLQKWCDHIVVTGTHETPPPEPEFEYKTYRCEWQIYAQEVDQYDRRHASGETRVFGSYETKERADAEVSKFLKGTGFQGKRLVPKDSTHTYWSGGVRYMEVPVDTRELL